MALVPRDLTAPEVEKVVNDTKATLTDIGGTQLILTDSGTWYRSEFGRCGNWESWIWETVTGRDYNTRRPNFNGFVVCGPKTLGRAHAGIVKLALRNGRPVLWWQEGHLESVVEIAENNPEDFTSGWEIYTRSLT